MNMRTTVDIGSLMERSPEIRKGQSCIAGTGVTPDFGKYASGSNPLEYARFSPGERTQADDDQPDLACVRIAAAPCRHVQASPDPQLIEKVRDIVGLYMKPPEHALVFCVDEKSQIQALA
jgi:hypothetical protein